MHPILVELGPLTIRTYGFLMALGVVSAIFLSLHLSKKYDLDRKILSDFFFYAILLGLIGAKIFLFFAEFSYYSRSFERTKELLFSGGAFQGGLIFGAVFAIWYLKKHKFSYRIVGDIVAPSVALAHFLGRMGCFFAGCCWGRSAHDCAIAIQFTHPKTSTGVPMHTPLYPTQLIESILNLLNFLVLLFVTKKKKFHGQVFLVYIFNYSLIRFFVEYFRGDDDRGYIIGSLREPFTSISSPQLISIIGIIIVVILYKRFSKTQVDGES